jgi:peptidoglycan L-alanyl-D-glutamate endopeptidase CwlK
MPRFSAISKQRLAECHSDLQILCDKLIENYDFSVVCGHRGEEAQNKAYKEKKSTKQWPDSKHNTIPSLAVDLAPYESTNIDWGKLQSAYFAGQVIGLANELFKQGIMKHRIRPGIDWNLNNDIDDTKFWDAGHFEIIPN